MVSLRACVLALAALPTLAGAQLAGYLVDSGGQAVRTSFGACVRSGSWSAAQPGIGCDASPDRVVLLPDPDGKAGAVILRAGSGEQVLDRAYAAADVAAGVIVVRQEDAASVQARYGKTLDSLPPRPVSFTVNFAAGSAAELTPESLPVIEAMKLTLARRPAPEITVIGHTDRVGKQEANDKLSAQRAETVREILTKAGVRAASMDVAGRGEREPLVATADDVDEPRNRRVEISVR